MSEDGQCRTWRVDPGLRFACAGCAACCRGWSIPADERFRHGLDEQALRLASPRLAGRALLVEDRLSDGTAVSFLAADRGRCIMLEDDGRCLIHRVLGPMAKPEVCRRFPFLLLRGPAADVLSLRLGCSSYHRLQRDGRAPLLAGRLTELAIELGREPDAELPPRLQLAPGRGLSGSAPFRLQQELLAAIDAAAEPVSALRGVAALLDPHRKVGPFGGGPRPGSGLAVALPAALPWLRALIQAEREAVAAEGLALPGLAVDPLAAGLAGLARLAAVADGLPAELAAGAARFPRDPVVDELLLGLLRGFTFNADFRYLPDLAAAFGALALLCIVAWRAAADLPVADRPGWLADTLPCLFRSAWYREVGCREEGVLQALRECLHGFTV